MTETTSPINSRVRLWKIVVYFKVKHSCLYNKIEYYEVS